MLTGISHVRILFIFIYGKVQCISEELVAKCLEFWEKYKSEGYEGDIILVSWDGYILAEDTDNADETNEDINEYINEDDGDDEDGFTMDYIREKKNFSWIFNNYIFWINTPIFPP